ncbi:hypothetical protein DO021_15460 [Desulfobacter hydrogenophilus]|uniref:DUF3955 domain-containing protein n=1 Tax=Desulfobacter hydrogenophilus TaxID=2291 RepID=A0A328FDE8_9BACT|nr:hypothetical protein [Desulfobacter hydrogenophilus]NDY73079.1 hypothetical protein [Desulfobacter hydrogenophilus]QBH13571.1 hypothetical protein EYB58_11925 [Desulfobacter hydrogenophilus]RAM01085.1 hypothetical protein DO021_15460 [Desulfobacter hydrogenophilus]
MKWKKLFIGIGLLFFCVLGIAWMMGCFAVPPEIANDNNLYLQEWAAPGFLALPAMISFIVGLVGLTLVFTSKRK